MRIAARALAMIVAFVVCVGIGGARATAAPDAKRKVIVLEYRAGSSALSGIAGRVVGALTKQTSLDVLGPDQARAEYGDHLEQSIVKCAGEADCIARIGAKVGAAEVVLVGVSELGDVILTMQRIDVADRSVRARVADSIPAGGHPSDEQLTQYLVKLLPPTDFVRFGVLDIVVSQVGAEVTVGGEKRGESPIEPLKLHAPAVYDIHVQKDGFLPWTASVKLPPDSELKLPVSLQRPGGRVAWYQHWYVLTAASLVVAGAAGATIYFVTQKTSDRVPVMGTLN